MSTIEGRIQIQQAVEAVTRQLPIISLDLPIERSMPPCNPGLGVAYIERDVHKQHEGAIATEGLSGVLYARRQPRPQNGDRRGKRA